MALTIMGLSFLLFLMPGVPVAFAIRLSAVCTTLYEGLPRASRAQLWRSILPFYAALIAALMLVTHVPAFRMTLPDLFIH